MLKEQLREAFRTQEGNPAALLGGWLAWAQRCRLKPVVALGRQIQRHRPAIVAKAARVLWAHPTTESDAAPASVTQR